MARTTTPPDITGTVRLACGCVATVMDARTTGTNPTVTSRVVIPCTPKITAGVILHVHPNNVEMRGPVAPGELEATS